MGANQTRLVPLKTTSGGRPGRGPKCHLVSVQGLMDTSAPLREENGSRRGKIGPDHQRQETKGGGGEWGILIRARRRRRVQRGGRKTGWNKIAFASNYCFEKRSVFLFFSVVVENRRQLLHYTPAPFKMHLPLSIQWQGVPPFPGR